MERKAIKRKASAVEALKEKILEAKTIVAFDDGGMTVKQSTDLRVKLHEQGCEMTIYKNNIARRALILAGYEETALEFTGKKVMVFSYEDVIAPAKIVYEFAKTNRRVKVKAGVIEGKEATYDEIIALATLPSYETLLTQLAAGLLMPIRELAIGLNMIATEQEGVEENGETN